MVRTQRAHIIALLLLVFGACSETDIDTRHVLAKVGESELLADEVYNSIPNNLSAEDSVELASSIIQNWMNRELMYDKAKYNLVTEQTDIEAQVEKYKKELFIFEYEKELVNQKLDTNISQAEIETFYDENQDIFQLNDYILKIRYIKLLPNSPDQDKVAKWMKSTKEKDKEKLDDYCHKYAVSCYNDSSWVFFNELLRELPIEVYNKESFLKVGKFVKFSDSHHVYYLDIQDLQSKNTLSPIDLEVKRIKSLILNRRKIELLSSIRTRLYRDAIKSGKAEIYETPKIEE